MTRSRKAVINNERVATDITVQKLMNPARHEKSRVAVYSYKKEK
jgi:hypothetical protein